MSVLRTPINRPIRTLKCLLDVDSVLCAGLKVGNATLRLAEGHGALRGDLVKVSVTIARMKFCQTHHPLALLDIDLVTNNNLSQSAMRYHLSTCPHTNGKLSGSMGLA